MISNVDKAVKIMKETMKLKEEERKLKQERLKNVNWGRERGNIIIIEDKRLMGQYSELMVASDLTLKGYEIFIPYNMRAPFDLIAYKKKKMKRIEVKTGYINSETFNLAFGPPTSDEWDILAIYLKNHNKIIYMNKKNEILDI